MVEIFLITLLDSEDNIIKIEGDGLLGFTSIQKAENYLNDTVIPRLNNSRKPSDTFIKKYSITKMKVI